jgi:hypothetical protein
LITSIQKILPETWLAKFALTVTTLVDVSVVELTPAPAFKDLTVPGDTKRAASPDDVDLFAIAR